MQETRADTDSWAEELSNKISKEVQAAVRECIKEYRANMQRKSSSIQVEEQSERKPFVAEVVAAEQNFKTEVVTAELDEVDAFIAELESDYSVWKSSLDLSTSSVATRDELDDLLESFIAEDNSDILLADEDFSLDEEIIFDVSSDEERSQATELEVAEKTTLQDHLAMDSKPVPAWIAEDRLSIAPSKGAASTDFDDDEDALESDNFFAMKVSPKGQSKLQLGRRVWNPGIQAGAQPEQPRSADKAARTASTGVH